MNRPSAGQAAALGGASIAAAAIAVAIAQIELSGQAQPHIWSNSWLLTALALASAGLMIAAVFFVIDTVTHKDSRSVTRQDVDDISRRCYQLAFDIYAFEDERGFSNDGTPEYDDQTIYLYHLKFGRQELDLGSVVQSMGVSREDLRPLFDKQTTTDGIHDTANYIKSIPGILANRASQA